MEAWGDEYYATKSFQRGAEDDVWRIVASVNNTTLTIDPPQGGMGTVTLNRGDVHQIISTSDFKVSADNPILMGQFLVGSNYTGIPTHPSCTFYDLLDDLDGNPNACDAFTCEFFNSGVCTASGGCSIPCTGSIYGTCADNGLECDTAQNVCYAGSGIGDPAYTLSVPTRQYRLDYIVLTPIGYEENHLTVISQVGNVPLIDGFRVNEAPYNATPTAIDGMYEAYRLSVSEGVHILQSNAGFGVTSYGYNCDVSYAYPGGLNLETN